MQLLHSQGNVSAPQQCNLRNSLMQLAVGAFPSRADVPCAGHVYLAFPSRWQPLASGLPIAQALGPRTVKQDRRALLLGAAFFLGMQACATISMCRQAIFIRAHRVAAFHSKSIRDLLSATENKKMYVAALRTLQLQRYLACSRA